MSDHAPGVLIRADGSKEMGLGHVARMATLAGAFGAMGADAGFATLRTCDLVLPLLAARDVRVDPIDAIAGTEADARATVAIAEQRSARIVVVDGYQFSDAYVHVLHDAGLFICYVDDLLRSPPGSDALLNNNVFAEPSLYTRSLPAMRLLGPVYALLADAFVGARRPLRPGPPRRLLVTMGGSDLTHQTLKVLSALQQVGDPLEVQVVAGAGNDPAYLGEIEAAARSSASHDVRVAHAVTDMARRMSWADLAITAAGSTCLELSCVGVPAIALATADNQRRVAEGCASRGLMVSLGWHEAVTPDDVARELNRLLRDDDARASMVHSQHLVVDGRGKERVARALLSGLDL